MPTTRIKTNDMIAPLVLIVIGLTITTISLLLIVIDKTNQTQTPRCEVLVVNPSDTDANNLQCQPERIYIESPDGWLCWIEPNTMSPDGFEKLCDRS